jgi:hypothetical protein
MNAVKNFRQFGAGGLLAPRGQYDLYGRIASAVGCVLRYRLGINDEVPMDLTFEQIADFLEQQDTEHLKKLKAVAECLVLDLDYVAPPSTNTKQ